MIYSTPLEHYQFCQSLLKRQMAQEDVACDFRRALRYPFAQSFQPSTAALAVLAQALQAPHPPVIPNLLPTGAPPGLLPLSIAWQLAELWRTLSDTDRELLPYAQRLAGWVERFGSFASSLYYPESLFNPSEQEKLNMEGEAVAYDSCLGLIAHPHACLTLTGCNSGLGILKMGSVEVRSFGPQLSPLSEPKHFGIMQSTGISAVSSSSKDRIDLEGWTRCYGDPRVWLHMSATSSKEAAEIDVRFVGGSSLFMVFYVSANTCTIDGSKEVFRPGNLQGYKGTGKTIFFNESVRLDCSPPLGLQIIPLADDGSFWNSRFLIAFEFNSCLSRASISFKFI